MTETIYGRFTSFIDNKGVGVAIQAVEELSEEEIDFLVAHELAHQQLGHLQKRTLLGIPVLVTMILCVALALGLSVAMLSPAASFAPFLLAFMLIFPYSLLTKPTLERQEIEADRLAVNSTGDKAIATKALRKIMLTGVSPGIDARIEAMSHV